MGVLATAMDTATERGPLMPSLPLPLRPSLRLRLMPMPTTAMVDTALAMEATAMAAMVDTDMERGQLTLMPMPTTAMVDTDTAMADTALATAMDMATARGPLMPMPTTDMAAMAVAMEVMVGMAAMGDTDTERGQ